MNELISAGSAIVGSLITVGGSLYLARRKEKKEKAIEPKCIIRVQYIKVIHLKEKGGTKKPIYQKKIPRLKNKLIDVYDEAIFYQYTYYDKPKANFKTKTRTSGVVDSQIIHPWQEELEFSDKGEALIEGHISQVITDPSCLFFTVSHLYNGCQPGNEDFGTKMPEDTESGRLVVDFSSLPHFSDIVKNLPKGFLCRHEKAEKPLTPVEYRPGIYSVSMSSLKVDDVLRLDFEIDWSKV